ncbi:hypothetical protein ACFQI7_27865 [Paenibacillus allorhizosphaerae]|uniref:Uncharacterized protein n=1 Tax=Paenibacillus allorhizosphaerae TaxID=2849866 RepID=A0ABN7TU37_9BACL|nr:hypothetical protein [Paenibacillus allorhizosphaerae]CAG7651747.1 hypothetical protein PAECIP111802_05041 [Paenibacillus allorhizosphaerae]
MRKPLFMNPCKQSYQQQPFGYQEITINHEYADFWREHGINGQFLSFLKAYIHPINRSFYVPRLGRSILKRGGTVLT